MLGKLNSKLNFLEFVAMTVHEPIRQTDSSDKQIQTNRWQWPFAHVLIANHRTYLLMNSSQWIQCAIDSWSGRSRANSQQGMIVWLTRRSMQSSAAALFGCDQYKIMTLSSDGRDVPLCNHGVWLLLIISNRDGSKILNLCL